MGITRQLWIVAAFVVVGAWLIVGCGNDEAAPTDQDTIDAADGSGGGEDSQSPPDTFPPSDADSEAVADSDPLDGDIDHTDGQDGMGPESPEEFLEEAVAALCPGYAALWCGAQAVCGCDAQPGFPGDCTSRFEASCAHELEGFLPAVRSGQALYHPQNASICLDALETAFAACILLPQASFLAHCPVLQPRLASGALPELGEPCQGLCAPGLVCGSAGVCSVPAQAGAECIAFFDCAPGLVCGEANQCVPISLTGVGDSCTGAASCPAELFCGASVIKSCESKISGAPCQWSEQCPADEYCVADDGSGVESACTPLPSLGEPCGNGVECAEGLACLMESGECGALPTGGQDCALGRFGPILCAEGFACVNGVCGQPPGLGDECGMGELACAPPLACNFESDGSFCRNRVGAGEPCQNDAICDDGLFCDFSLAQCAPYLNQGGPCSAGNECGPGSACLPDPNFSFRCAPRPGLGEPCFIDECEDNLNCTSPYSEGACVPPICSALKF